MRPVLLPCLALVLLASPSSAAPIRASIHLQRTHDGPESILFPEDFASRGGTIVLGTRSFGPYHPDGRLDENGNPTPWRVPIEEGFGMLLFFDGDSPEQPAGLRPGVVIGAMLVGELGYNAASSHNLNGFWEGTAIETSMSSLFDLALLPEDQRGVIDTLLDPDRLSISGSVHGGSENAIDIILTVAPAPVPEPATLAAWGVVGLGALAIRRRRRS